MKINNYNKLPQGINDIADLQIHEASMLVGAAIKTLSDLKPHWDEEVFEPFLAENEKFVAVADDYRPCSNTSEDFNDQDVDWPPFWCHGK